MKKTEFYKTVDEGVKRGKCFMVLKIENESYDHPQILIEPVENIYEKLDYYSRNYDNDMVLNQSKAWHKLIKITDVLMTSNLTDLNWFAY